MPTVHEHERSFHPASSCPTTFHSEYIIYIPYSLICNSYYLLSYVMRNPPVLNSRPYSSALSGTPGMPRTTLIEQYPLAIHTPMRGLNHVPPSATASSSFIPITTPLHNRLMVQYDVILVLKSCQPGTISISLHSWISSRPAHVCSHVISNTCLMHRLLLSHINRQ